MDRKAHRGVVAAVHSEAASQLEAIRQNADLTTMIWSHHWPEQHDHCATIRGRLVCRRCMVLHPVTAVVLLLSVVGAHWPTRFDSIALFVFPIPVVIDFVGEQLRLFRYNARRQIVTTVLAGLALGRSFGRYFADDTDSYFWSVVLLYGGLCGAALVIRFMRDRQVQDRSAALNEAIDPFTVGFENREAFVAYLDSVDPTRIDSSVI
jgi:hypothetical protein